MGKDAIDLCVLLYTYILIDLSIWKAQMLSGDSFSETHSFLMKKMGQKFQLNVLFEDAKDL